MSLKYYFGIPDIPKMHDYTLLYHKLTTTDVLNQQEVEELSDEYHFFILESCRFYVDGMDSLEIKEYYKLVRSAYDNLLIHRDKIEAYFKEYVDYLFNFRRKMVKKPANISEVLVETMLSELDITKILKHVNTDTQQVDMQSISSDVKLDKINKIKKLHDTVLFFIEYYNRRESL